jgi:hypothetical protein
MTTLTLAPNGLQWIRNKQAYGPNFATNNIYYIKQGYASAIAFGDLVSTGSSGNAGYVTQYVAGAGNPVLGVFVGVSTYFDTVQNSPVAAKNYWAGTESPSGDVACFIIDDPFAVFRIQVSGGPITTASRGLNADVTGSGAPNSFGLSTAALNFSTVATTSTLPLRIIGWSAAAVQSATGSYDPTQGSSANQPTNNYAEVTLNPGACESLLGTGI